MASKVRIALIYGSAREGRFCEKLIEWARAHISLNVDFELDVIDPRDYGFAPASATHPRRNTLELRQHIDRADAFIVVVPEYNHGYPAALKELIDSAYREWNAKPAAFISYGAMSGGIRAVEQLRQVFAELHVVTTRDGVAFPYAWDKFDDSGNLHDPERFERALNTMLAQLQWWAKALRNARDADAYNKVAA